VVWGHDDCRGRVVLKGAALGLNTVLGTNEVLSGSLRGDGLNHQPAPQIISHIWKRCTCGNIQSIDEVKKPTNSSYISAPSLGIVVTCLELSYLDEIQSN
jgi:hypothetical protein